MNLTEDKRQRLIELAEKGKTEELIAELTDEPIVERKYFQSFAHAVFLVYSFSDVSRSTFSEEDGNTNAWQKPEHKKIVSYAIQMLDSLDIDPNDSVSVKEVHRTLLKAHKLIHTMDELLMRVFSSVYNNYALTRGERHETTNVVDRGSNIDSPAGSGLQ
jgi:hypothetical protein